VIKYIIFLLLAVFLKSCECPPNLDTDKDFVPEFFSLVNFMNINGDNSSCDIYTSNLKVFSNCKSLDTTNRKFEKFPSGLNNFRIQSGNNILLNTILSTKQNKYYSLIFYKKASYLDYLLIEEEIDLSLNSSFLRFANFSENQSLKITIKSNQIQNIEILLTINTASLPLVFPSKSINIEIANAATGEIIQQISEHTIFSNGIEYCMIVGDKISNKVIFSKANF
jgi:hypothetical protein